MQTIDSFSKRLPLHRNWIAEFNRRVFVRAHSPDLAVGTRPPQIFRPFTNGRWYLTVISVSAMRCFASAAWLTSGRFKSFCAETVPPSPRMARQRANGLSVIVFIVVALTLLKFSIVRYQIIKDFASPLSLARSSEALPGSSLFAGEFSHEHMDPHNHPISPAHAWRQVAMASCSSS